MPEPRPETDTPLAETGTALLAWARLMRLMRRLMLGMVALVALAVVAIARHRGAAPVRFAVIAALGMGLVMLLGAGLLGVLTARAQRRRLRGGDGATPSETAEAD